MSFNDMELLFIEMEISLGIPSGDERMREAVILGPILLVVPIVEVVVVKKGAADESVIIDLHLLGFGIGICACGDIETMAINRSVTMSHVFLGWRI